MKNINLKYNSLPSDYWDLVEIPGYLKRILYSDTDSIFIKLDEIPNDGNEAGKIAINTGNEINEELKQYYYHYLSKIGVDTDNWFFINFKTETAMESQLFTGVKKHYAYNLIFELTKNGSVVYDIPKLCYKGLPLKKSDTSKFVKDFMEEMLILALGKEKKKYKLANEIAKKYYDIYLKCLDEYDFKYIGKPSKNTKKPNILTGSRLYNTLVGHEDILKGQSVIAIYIDVLNPSLFKNLDINFLKESDYNKLNNLCLPYNYDSNKIKDLLDKYNIKCLNEFIPMKKEKRPKIFYSTNGEETPLKKIIEVIKLE